MPGYRGRRVTPYSATIPMRPDKRLRARYRYGGVGASPAWFRLRLNVSRCAHHGPLLPDGSRHRVVAPPWSCPGYPLQRVGARNAARWSLSAVCLEAQTAS